MPGDCPKGEFSKRDDDSRRKLSDEFMDLLYPMGKLRSRDGGSLGALGEEMGYVPLLGDLVRDQGQGTFALKNARFVKHSGKFFPRGGRGKGAGGKEVIP